MGAKEIAAPSGHHDQSRDPQLREFGVIAENRSSPQAETGKRQCHRAHEFGRVPALGKAVPGLENERARTPLRFALKDCIGTLISFESQVKTNSTTYV